MKKCKHLEFCPIYSKVSLQRLRDFTLLGQNRTYFLKDKCSIYQPAFNILFCILLNGGTSMKTAMF